MEGDKLWKFIIIGFTTPEEWDSPSEEAAHITRFLQSGAIDIFHLRKPDTDTGYVKEIIEKIPEHLHSRLVLHSHFHLIFHFKPGGIHHKESCEQKFIDYGVNNRLIISKSCHSIKEVESLQKDNYEYCFLSPIYDSISKEDYKARFSINDPRLLKLNKDYRIIALGGIIPSHFQNLYAAKFAGAALLGYLWSPKTGIEEKIKYLKEARIKTTQS